MGSVVPGTFITFHPGLVVSWNLSFFSPSGIVLLLVFGRMKLFLVKFYYQ